MKQLFKIWILITVFGCYSCNDTKEILLQAGNIVDTYPDSALTVLSNIQFPEKLSDPQKAEYGWIMTQAYSNLGSALKTDSLIRFSLEYYKNNNYQDRLLECYQLAIRNYYWNEDVEKASSLIEEGLQLAQELNDSTAISHFYYCKTEIQSTEEAAASFRKIKEYDKSREREVDYWIAILYSNTHEIDSAKYYYEKSIEAACLTNDPAGSHYLRNYGMYLYAIKDKKGALRAMQQAMEYNPEYSSPSLYYTSSLIHLQQNQIDSARLFLDKARYINEQNPDKFSPKYIASHNSILNTELILDYAQGKHINTNEINSYTDALVEDLYLKQSEFREQMTMKNLLDQQNLKLKIKNQKAQMQFIILISLFIISTGSIYIYIQKKKRKLDEIEEKNETLEHLLKDVLKIDTEDKESPHFFKRILLQQLGLIRLVATSPTTQNQALLQQISLITHDELPVDSLLVWSDLYPIIDSIYENFYTNMKARYEKTLLEKEMQLCCLLCAEFSTKEISVVTQQSVRTVYQRKTTIRQKLNIDEKGDIIDFIKKQEQKISHSHSYKQMAAIY